MRAWGEGHLAIVAGPYGTNWVYAALMLTPFALLLPIGHALARGYVWLALIPLPLAGVLINRFVREPRGRGFNRYTPTNRANSDVVRPAALCRFGLVTTLGLVSHIASAQRDLLATAFRRLLLEFCL